MIDANYYLETAESNEKENMLSYLESQTAYRHKSMIKEVSLL
jgi:hypothetical protein